MPFAIPFKKARHAKPGSMANPGSMVERLLDDPIMDLLMTRDGVTRADVLAVLETVRRNRRTRPFDEAA